MAEWALAPPMKGFFSTMTVLKPACEATVEAVRPPMPVPTTTTSASMSQAGVGARASAANAANGEAAAAATAQVPAATSERRAIEALKTVMGRSPFGLVRSRRTVRRLTADVAWPALWPAEGGRLSHESVFGLSHERWYSERGPGE